MNPADPFDPDPDINPEDDEMFERREGRRAATDRLGVGDFVRKAIDGAVGGGGSLSREAVDRIQYLIQQGDRTRKEVLRIVAAEVGDFLKSTDLSREVTKILTSVKVDVNASIRFSEVDEGRGVQPVVTAKDVSVSAGDDEERPAGEGAEDPDE